MKLSIIIVNYNVKYFLRQLLHSIYASETNFAYEIIVVDNDSADGSVEFLRKEFPEINLIESKVNLGFSKANNIGIQQSKGEYVLLLNPDTIVQEDTLAKSIEYMDAHSNAGALGCRMIDGAGNFLPESKRGFPTPRVALFKAIGLSKLFPGSRYFNTYYLGYLDDDQIHNVDVLTGAFMLLRKSVLDQSGLLDEDFFMYGEDIDLSYRIKMLGYDVVYFPETTIIHFKGESTKKQSASYVKRFYGAMQIFAKKHYKGRRAFLLRLFLQLGINLRAGLAILNQLVNRFGPAFMDWALIAVVLKGFSMAWAHFYFEDKHYYEASKIDWNISIDACIWVAFLFLFGAYDRIYNFGRVMRGWFGGWVGVLLLYALLPEYFRPSRSLVLAGGALSFMAIFLWRGLLFRIKKGSWPFSVKERKNYAVIGEQDEATRISKLLSSSHNLLSYKGVVGIDTTGESGSHFLGELDHLDQIVRFHKLDEIIFCSGSVPSSEIMQWMTRLGPGLVYKIAPDRSLGIIGSSSKQTSGELYTFDIKYNLGDQYLQRNKRLFDIVFSLLAAFLSPFLLGMVTEKRNFVHNIWSVLIGQKSWVSYASRKSNEIFPPLREGVIRPTITLYREDDLEALIDADYYYARDYSVWKDFYLVINNIKNLGSTSTKI